MKKVLAALVLSLTATTAQAHLFWPDDYTMIKGAGHESMIITHLKSQDDSYYKFTINGIPLGDSQLVYANSVVDFPIIVPHGIITGDNIIVCSRNLAKNDMLEKEVCLKIKVD